MNIDNPTSFLKNISIIIGIVIGGWFTLEAIFVTRDMMARHEVREVEREIDTGEKIRDHYQTMLDNGKKLEPEESRRMRVNGNKLDRLYVELKDNTDYAKELSR